MIENKRKFQSIIIVSTSFQSAHIFNVDDDKNRIGRI